MEPSSSLDDFRGPPFDDNTVVSEDKLFEYTDAVKDLLRASKGR